eukprot:CAMPEP_0172830620 /NCGR_PEP_ID=MMETSP1075-20121228/22394_1 /TAXON_ID=2916 /ORGANISM="Ceratium fusus, Strain PA161109" /LENGTH=36 /DNA_ID= /DNA_START= /DNA_END= /DNA_ORIENTATION=
MPWLASFSGPNVSSEYVVTSASTPAAYAGDLLCNRG